MQSDTCKRKIFGEITLDADIMLDLIKGVRGYKNKGLALEEAIKLLYAKVLAELKNKVDS